MRSINALAVQQLKMINIKQFFKLPKGTIIYFLLCAQAMNQSRNKLQSGINAWN